MGYGYFLAILAAALWGLNYALDQRALSSLPVLKLYFLHSIFGVVVSAAIWVGMGRPLAHLSLFSTHSISLRLIALTLVIGTAAGLVIFASIQALNASRASVIEISYPFFVALFSYLLFGETINWAVLAGGATIFCGAAIIVVWG